MAVLVKGWISRMHLDSIFFIKGTDYKLLCSNFQILFSFDNLNFEKAALQRIFLCRDLFSEDMILKPFKIKISSNLFQTIFFFLEDYNLCMFSFPFRCRF